MYNKMIPLAALENKTRDRSRISNPGKSNQINEGLTHREWEEKRTNSRDFNKVKLIGVGKQLDQKV